ncbi:MAG: hypothetical protein KJZ87_16620, partial [Thermoguttaceae bacterium]|nr:hypothetical protein [Thermoguttaceae bacterium]
RSRAKNRRGVLLLLLLGLLAMFGVVAITFVLITGQYRRAASLGRTGESPLEEEQELLDNAFKQLVRGDKKSIMGCLSLLEDMYGNRTFGAPDAAGNATPQGMIVNKPNTTFVRLVAPGTVAGRSRGQILEFTAAMVDPTNPQNTAYMPDPYRYVGQVLTFLDGPARHQSVPIIGYRIDSINNQAVLQTVAPDVSPEDLMENYFYRGARCRYIINGSAFSGTGFGLKTLSAGAPDPVPDTQDGLLEATTYPNSIATANASLSPFYPEIALMPNAPEGREPAGGANEDYDAADLQNPHLATILRDGTVPSPSFHRPEIVRYWLNRIKTVAAEDPSDPNQFAVLAQKYLSAPADKLACRIIFRPLPKYHPNFTGSNPAFQLALGHYASGFNPLWSGIRLEQDANSNGTVEPAEYRWDWDVDSDGDGTPDSIWVDLGMPVRSDADGRLYKPLFAIFCTDLDGRLNVNAHGAHMHRDPSFTSVVDPNNPAFAPPGMMSMGGMFAFAGGAPLALPRGLGYAPFEISLAPLFSSPLDYQAVIANRYYSVIPATGTPEYLPGTANADDFLSWNMWSQYGGAYWNMTAAGNAGSYGSPPDFDGDMVVGLDPGGRPIYSRAAIGDHVDDPGELDLAGSASVDSPYTPAELEPILRPYDTDSASLISRLLPPTLTASSNLVAYRNLLTTDSWDVPVPNLSVPEDIVRRLIAEINGTGATAPVPAVKTWLISLYPPRHMSDVLALKAYFEYRVRDTSGGGLAARQTNAMTHARQIAAAASQVLSWDLMTGLKMDINRPFGNGQDQAIDLDLPPDGIPDTINNVVDEPGRIIRNTSSPYALKLDTGFMGPPRFFGFPGESADGTETTLLRDRTGALIPNIGFNHVDGFDVNGDGTVDQIDKALVRQWYARHLYVLMMLLADERAFYGTNKTDPTDPQDGFRVYSQAEDERKARTIAQWAINVVDFRDRDSIMTPFEYDIYPFTNPVVNMSGTPPVFDNNGPNNTWDVDGIIEANPNNPDLLPPSGTAPYIDDGQPYRGLVWGCERPELLITETLATHDFRLQDLDTDNGDAKKTTDTPNPDDDYDNLKRPEGSLFIELYNPWTNLEPAPAELYSSLTGGGVDLARVVPDRPDPNQPGLAVNWPVWRMIFVPGDNTMAALDPDDPENWPRNGGTLVAERSLYFTNPTGAISLTVPPQETAKPLTGADANHGTEQFYPDVPVGVIPPGGYAVIGPGLPQAAVSGSGTDYVTYFGKRSSDPGDPQTQEPTDANQTRQIRLNVGGANPAESPVKANTNPQLEPQTGQIRNVVSIVVNEPNRLNLTEPDGGYPDTIPGATFDSNSTRMYLTAVPGGSPMASDTPLDAGRTDRIGAYLNPADPPTVQARVSIAHLQRLANPLQPWH